MSYGTITFYTKDTLYELVVRITDSETEKVEDAI